MKTAQRWLRVNPPWQLRSLQDGLELISPERNIALEFSHAQRNRDELAAILEGDQAIPRGANGGGIRKLVAKFLQQGILRYESEERASTVKSPLEQRLWFLRSKFLGSQGPVRTIYHLDPKESALNVRSHMVTAKYTRNGTDVEEWTGGTDKDPMVAELKAIMEALERWASGVVPKGELKYCSKETLGSQAINPELVVAYKSWQYARSGFGLVPFSPTQVHKWKPISAFPSQNQHYLPIECLYYPLTAGSVPNRYTFASSSGIAAAFSFEKAVVQGTLEAIERDAFMLAWLNKMSLPRISHAELPYRERLRIQSFEELGYGLHIVNLTQDMTPVALTVAVGYDKKPALVLGAASHFNFLDAISKAIGEVEHQVYWGLRHAQEAYSISDPKMVYDVPDHMALYASPKYLPKAEFLWMGPEAKLPSIQDPNDEEELNKLLAVLKSRGIKLFTADLTPPAFRKVGISVIRSIPFGLVPICFGYGMEPLGMSRIRAMRGNWKGWRQKPFTHPFA